MRTRTQLQDLMTYEEYRSIEERATKLLLLGLLTEAGYDTLKMQRHKFTVDELKKRLIAKIRSDKLVIKTLNKTLSAEQKKYTENLDTLFDQLRELKGTVIK